MKKTLLVGLIGLFLVTSSFHIGDTNAHDDGDNFSNYIQPNDKLVKKIVQEKISSSMPLIKRAEILYYYVTHNIKYRNDKEVWGVEDYWQFPSTTLEKGTGDCEDQAILLTSLLRSAGFPRENVRLVYGKIVKLFSGELVGGHCWVEIKLSPETFSQISQLYVVNTQDLEEKNITLHTNDRDISLTIDKNKFLQYKTLGIGAREGWIPLDTSSDPPMPFWVWIMFGYYTYYALGLKAETIETYIDPVPPTKVILSLEKEEYKVSESIIFTVTNTGEEDIIFPNTAPFTIYQFIKSGFYGLLKPVYTPIALPVTIPLKPNGSVNFSWNQKDNEGNQVKEGEYIIVVYYYENGEGKQISKGFKIISPESEWCYYNFSINPYTRVKLKIYLPKEIEINKEYDIPFYFMRENVAQLTGKTIVEDALSNLNVFVGLGKISDENFCYISIELNPDNKWWATIPIKESDIIVIHTPLSSSSINLNSQYIQTISLQTPCYNYLTDIPSDWDGPYRIILKVNKSTGGQQLVTPYSSSNIFIPSSEEVVKYISLGGVEVINTPSRLNYVSPDNLSISIGISFGQELSTYYLEKMKEEYYLVNNNFKIKVETPLTINNSKLFVAASVPIPALFGSSYTPVNIAPETIIEKEKFVSVKSIKLTADGLTPIYEIKGVKKEKLLGIFPVKETVIIEVNAVNGEKISTKEPWWGFLT